MARTNPAASRPHAQAQALSYGKFVSDVWPPVNSVTQGNSPTVPGRILAGRIASGSRWQARALTCFTARMRCV